MKKSLILFFTLVVSGCAPVYQKFYTYEPMRSQSQRSCALTCQVMRQSCQLNEQQTYQLCKANARLEYQSCKNNETWGYNSKGKYECQYNCYCYESSCDEPDKEACEAQYASCYTGCGGKVTETTGCVANCEKESAAH